MNEDRIAELMAEVAWNPRFADEAKRREWAIGVEREERAQADRPVQRKPARPIRKAGRPRGTRTFPKHMLVATFRNLHRNYGRRPTQEELAANLTPRIAVRTLQAHLTAYKLGWPIE